MINSFLWLLFIRFIFLNNWSIWIPRLIIFILLFLLFLLLLLQLNLLCKLSCKICTRLFSICLKIIWLYLLIFTNLWGSAINIKHKLCHRSSIFFIIDRLRLQWLKIFESFISKSNNIWICIHITLRSKRYIILLFLFDFNFSICVCKCIR